MKHRASFILAASLGLANCTIVPVTAPASVEPSPTRERDFPAPRPAPRPSPRASLVYGALGQTVALASVRVTPLEVLEDSRCPTNARCVWAGQVRLRIRVRSSSGLHTMEIASGKPLGLAGGKLELAKITPEKIAGQGHDAIAPAAYRFGFGFISGL